MRTPNKVESLSILKQRGVDFEVVLDVGIMSGTPELAEVFPDKWHLLFEPVAEFKQKIEEFYKDIPHNLITAAVSDRSGEIKLRVRALNEGDEVTHSGIEEGSGEAGEVLRTVPMWSLDDFVKEHEIGGKFLLKIDVDGYELKILHGAAGILARCPILIMELPKFQLAQRILEVESFGYELFDLAEPCYYDDAFWQCDGIFIRSGLMGAHFKDLSNNFNESLYSMYK